LFFFKKEIISSRQNIFLFVAVNDGRSMVILAEIAFGNAG
jgi:hypothetical protein